MSYASQWSLIWLLTPCVEYYRRIKELKKDTHEVGTAPCFLHLWTEPPPGACFVPFHRETAEGPSTQYSDGGNRWPKSAIKMFKELNF